MSASEDLTKINQAIDDLTAGKRVQKIRVNGKELTYAEINIDDLLKMRRDCEYKLSKENNRRRIRSKSLIGGKGL